jgi:hypothetical protein
MIAEQWTWLRACTLAAVWRLLQRLGIHYKRARDYIHSPDPDYQAKRRWIAAHQARAQREPERWPLLYLDEFSYYRQPELAWAYEAVGHRQPLARRSYAANTCFRAVGTLDAVTGRVLYRQRSHITTTCLSHFFAQVHAAYPQAESIAIVLDNWPVHFHPDVLGHLQPQHFPWPLHLPNNWPTEPRRQPFADKLPIRLLCLPTYASWLNPIEKLWRWLKQEVIRLHRCADDWPTLVARVAAFLDRFAYGSTDLLHYVGLLPY